MSEIFEGSNKKINRIVPGDVFYWYYDNGTFTSHIAIVDKVDVNPYTGNVQDITLIESTFGYYKDEGGHPRTQMVRMGLSLRNLYKKSIKDHYHIVRLREKN